MRDELRGGPVVAGVVHDDGRGGLLGLDLLDLGAGQLQGVGGDRLFPLGSLAEDLAFHLLQGFLGRGIVRQQARAVCGGGGTCGQGNR